MNFIKKNSNSILMQIWHLKMHKIEYILKLKTSAQYSACQVHFEIN